VKRQKGFRFILRVKHSQAGLSTSLKETRLLLTVNMFGDFQILNFLENFHEVLSDVSAPFRARLKGGCRSSQKKLTEADGLLFAGDRLFILKEY